MDKNTDFVLDNNLLEELSRCNTPVGVRPIFEFSDVNQNIPCICDFSLDDFGRESLGIINLDNLDVGRESLWITNLKSTEIVGDNVISEMKRTNLMDSNDSGILNTAFLKPTKDSARSSTSSCDSICSSLNLLNINNNISSRLVSYCESDILNGDFMESVNRRSSVSPIYLNDKLNNVNQLYQSDTLSSMLEDIMNIQICHKHIRENNEILSPVRSKGKLQTESNEGFNDSVFIEANHLAARIEDGSIYDLGLRENDMLDSIQEPEDLVNLSTDKAESAVCGTTAVFRMVDKVLPSPLNHNLPLAISSEQNISNISMINESKSKSKDKDPKDILSTLSEILNNDNLISKKQKYEAQNMISNLAAILISNGNNKIKQLDDSGHSSIENDQVMISPEHECYEVLDLRKKKSSETACNQTQSIDNCYPLDLSLKSKFVSEKVTTGLTILPFTYNNHPKSLVKENNIYSNYLISNSQNNNLDDNKNKFKLKKTEENINLRKGPMKAVVPLDNMARRKSGGSKLNVTPKRRELQLSSKQKKLTTPVNGLIMKPIAQSTPEVVSSGMSSLIKPPTTSPAVQSVKVVKQKLSYARSSLHSISNKTQDLNNKKTSFVRRHSVDDINKSQEAKMIPSRSSSVGRNSILSSVVSNVQQTALTAKQNSRKTGNLPSLKENRSKSVSRPLSGKRNGKENFC